MFGGDLEAGGGGRGRIPGHRPIPLPGSSVMIQVLVVDDQALVRAGFRVLVDSADDLEVVGEAAHGEEAIRLAASFDPDVILRDIRMPVMDGLQATAQIIAASDTARVLVQTTFDLDEHVFAALKAGASGFLLKDTPPADLLNGIRVVAAGEALLAPSITRHLIEEFVRGRPQTRPTPPEPGDLATLREAVRLDEEWGAGDPLLAVSQSRRYRLEVTRSFTGVADR